MESFIAVKGFKAKGKRLSNYEIKKVEELEPSRIQEEEVMEIIEDEPERAEEKEIAEVIEDNPEPVPDKADEVELIIEETPKELLVDDAMDEDEPTTNKEKGENVGEQMTLGF